MGNDEGSEIIAREVPPTQAVGRGRAFVRTYATILGVAVIAFIVLAVFVRLNDTLRFDVTIAQAVQGVQFPLSAWLLTHASDLGWFPQNAITYAVVIVVLFALRLRLEAIIAVAASILAGLVGGGIKLLVGRARPATPAIHIAAQLTGNSFPSGHVIQYVTLFGFVFYVVLVVWDAGVIRNLVLVALALPILFVGPSRVYLGQHWPTDVLGAYLFAGLWLAGTIELHLYLKRWMSARQNGGAPHDTLSPGAPRRAGGSAPPAQA